MVRLSNQSFAGAFEGFGGRQGAFVAIRRHEVGCSGSLGSRGAERSWQERSVEG